MKTINHASNIGIKIKLTSSLIFVLAAIFMLNHVLNIVDYHALFTNSPPTEQSFFLIPELDANLAAVEDCPRECCAYTIVLANDSLNLEEYSKIKVTALGFTQIINGDPDYWTQNANLPYSVEWIPPLGVVPVGWAIDNDFMIFLEPQADQSLQVDWYDLNGVVTCRQIINVPCQLNPDEDEDWTAYTTRTILDDPEVWSIAVQEEDTDDCGSDNIIDKNAGCMDIDISCVGGQYQVKVDADPGYSAYQWSVSDDGQNIVSSGTGNPFSFMLSTSGSYGVKLTTLDGNGQPVYSCSEDFIIPDMDPDFSSRQRECFLSVDFVALVESFDFVASYSWECLTVVGFPASGGSVFFTFPTSGTYDVKLTVKDIYGCEHEIKKEVLVSFDCRPKIGKPRYTLCSKDCIGGKAVEVTFENLSQGGKCPVSYEWDFGDGSPVSTLRNPKHTYNIDCPKATFYVTLTMKDGSTPTPCIETVTRKIIIKHCNYSIDIVPCPDGRVTLNANACGTWTVLGNHTIAPWPYSSWRRNCDTNATKYTRKRLVVRYKQSGNYPVSFTGIDENGCECSVYDTIKVVIEHCAKNDADRDFAKFSDAGKNYKFKYKLVQRQLPLYHAVRVKSKLKRKRRLLYLIGYWKGTKADEIEASVTGKIYTRDPITKCNCKEEKLLGSPSCFKTNSTKAKCEKFFWKRFRSKKNSLISTHRVKIGSTVVTRSLDLGNDFDPFRWWTDWF